MGFMVSLKCCHFLITFVVNTGDNRNNCSIAYLGVVRASLSIEAKRQNGFPSTQTRHWLFRSRQSAIKAAVEGTEDEIRRAEPVLSRWGIQEWRVFYTPTTLS